MPVEAKRKTRNTQLSKLSDAWTIIHNFATTEMKLPQAEMALKTLLGDHYVDSDWQPALKAVMDAEEDVEKALTAINQMQQAIIPMVNPDMIHQCKDAEQELVDAIKELKDRHLIRGEIPSIEDLVNDPVEQEIGESAHLIGGDDDIVKVVKGELAEVVEVESESEEEEKAPSMTRADMLELCQKLENCCLEVDADCSYELQRNLRQFCAHIVKDAAANTVQQKLTSFWAGETWLII